MTARKRGRSAVLLAVALATAGVAGGSLARAAGDGPTFPTAGGSTFATDMDGWKAIDDSACEVLGLNLDPLPVCSVANERVADHDGALVTTFTALANVQGTITGLGGFVSPAFTVPADAQVGGARLSLDRNVSSDAPILDAGATAMLAIDLVDTTDGQNERRTQVLTKTLTAGDAGWVTEGVALPAGALVAGHTYRLEATSELTSQQVQALQGSVSLGLDNVALTVTAPAADGAPGADGSNGATGDAGAAGAAGAAGSAGQPGTPGTSGAFAPQGTSAPSQTIAANRAPSPQRARVNSPAARRLLRIDRLMRVQSHTALANQLRVRVFCRNGAGARCEGTLVIRSAGRINARVHSPGRRMRRVTLGTGSYQLPRRRLGYAKVMLTQAGRTWLERRGPFKVEVLVTVLDQGGRQQRLRRTFRASIG